MITTARPVAIRFDEDTFWVDLEDGRTLGVPIIWFPRLFHASVEARAEFELSAIGVHWDELNEDVSIAGLLAGNPDQTRRAYRAS